MKWKAQSTQFTQSRQKTLFLDIPLIINHDIHDLFLSKKFIQSVKFVFRNYTITLCSAAYHRSFLQCNMYVLQLKQYRPDVGFLHTISKEMSKKQNELHLLFDRAPSVIMFKSLNRTMVDRMITITWSSKIINSELFTVHQRQLARSLAALRVLPNVTTSWN